MLELNVFGEDAVFDHIGLALESIKDVFGDKLEIVSDDIQKVSVAFVKMAGITVELIEPLSENSPVNSSLKNDQRLVHLCFQVSDIGDAIKKGRKNGFHCIAKPVPAKAFKNKKIAWLYSKTYGLVELLEK